MKKTKNLIIIGVIIALAVVAGAYFTMGEGYQGYFSQEHIDRVSKELEQNAKDNIQKELDRTTERMKKLNSEQNSGVQERDVDCEANPEECAGAIN